VDAVRDGDDRDLFLGQAGPDIFENIPRDIAVELAHAIGTFREMEGEYCHGKSGAQIPILFSAEAEELVQVIPSSRDMSRKYLFMRSGRTRRCLQAPVCVCKDAPCPHDLDSLPEGELLIQHEESDALEPRKAEWPRSCGIRTA